MSGRSPRPRRSPQQRARWRGEARQRRESGHDYTDGKLSTEQRLLPQLRVNPTGELSLPMPIPAGNKVLDERDGLVAMPEAKAVLDAFAKRDYGMHVGHFLVDRSGVVRWIWIESPSPEDISQYGRFPTDDEIMAAVRVAGV